MRNSSSKLLRILVSAPFGRDAEGLAELLAANGFRAEILGDLSQIAQTIDESVGVLVLTEEALAGDLSLLGVVLEQQPSWSDVPVVLLAGRPSPGLRRSDLIRRRLPAAASNVVILERPLSGESLVSSIAAAMSSRAKQLEIRDRIAELARSEQALREESEALETLNRVGQALSAELNLDELVQSVVDAGRRIAGASVGAFFYNRTDDTGESYMLYALSGAPREAFAKFPMPRNTAVFAPTFSGEGIVRSNDITQDPRYGKSDTHWGMPKGHLKVVSYLAVPVTSRSGEVIGGLFYGHPKADVFKERSERLLIGLAAQAAVAIDNARLFQASQQHARTLHEKLEERTAALQAEAVARARVEDALHQSQKMEAVGQLTGGIAHDFNNMLAGIIGGLDIIKRRIATGRLDDLGRFMEATSTSAQRAASLTNRLLAFSRRQALDPRPVDIGELVRSFEDLLRRTIGEQIRIEIRIGSHLPAAQADANQLENAILNLAINARDAMPDGGHLTIAVEAVELSPSNMHGWGDVAPGQFLAIAVSDTGVGMSEGMLKKVFEPFFTTKPIGQGTGLGLSMVYGFARQSGGQVRIQSVEKQGTTVTILVPAAAERPARLAATPLASPDGSGQTVLVVEDDPSVRLLVKEVLSELGYMALEAASAEPALRILSSKVAVDLLVTDVGLPGMDGRQLAEIVRQTHPDLPILLITGYAREAAARDDFIGANMQMLRKPFALEVLGHKVREMLDGAGTSS